MISVAIYDGSEPSRGDSPTISTFLRGWSHNIDGWLESHPSRMRCIIPIIHRMDGCNYILSHYSADGQALRHGVSSAVSTVNGSKPRLAWHASQRGVEVSAPTQLP